MRIRNYHDSQWKTWLNHPIISCFNNSWERDLYFKGLMTSLSEVKTFYANNFWKVQPKECNLFMASSNQATYCWKLELETILQPLWLLNCKTESFNIPKIIWHHQNRYLIFSTSELESYFSNRKNKIPIWKLHKLYNCIWNVTTTSG
jgi:hypothetical protein